MVINIVNYDIVEQMSLSSTEYERGVNEFKKAEFTQVSSDVVSPPRVDESSVSFECTVENVMELGNQGGAGNLIISRVERIHIHTKYLNNSGVLDTQKLDLVARMGESWYCRASGEALFEISKPILKKGIGVDKLPSHVLKSNILTGNHLGRLGNMEELPSMKKIKKQQKSHEIQRILQIKDTEEKQSELHRYALISMENNDLKNVLSILFCLN